ncbi:MAG: membrane protein insertase YidC [Crocinitomicaceae bacterium]
MDRNTVIGLVLIGLILSVFTIFNQPTADELKEKQRLEQEKAKAESKLDVNEVKKVDKTEVAQNPTKDSDTASTAVASEKQVAVAKSEIVRLESDKLIIDFDTQGGKIASVRLKEFQSYFNFAKNNGKTVPLQLFAPGDASNALVFKSGGKMINTDELVFDIVKKTKNSIHFSYSPANGKSIDFTYTLPKDNFNISYDVNLKGMKSDIQNKNIQLEWKTAFKKTERLFSEQRRISTICFQNEKDGFDYLSEMSDDEEKAEDNISWVAYKQSYFSSILKPKTAFRSGDSKMEVINYKEGEKKNNTHLKDFSSTLALDMQASDDATMSFNWFFGPNDFEVLKSYGEGYDDILNYGWGLFRWINIYAVQPLFNFLLEMGFAVGIAILLLTMILKLVLMPIQWKMYVSSAKMKILKPEIDELNAKFPDKADAMKKQTEMMALYRESGASPLAGCVPMLIQMPILLAVFRFFPTSFELRQKGFLWATDLSSYDSIAELGTYIWPYGDHVSLFTLLMAGTTLIYTYVNSGQMQTPQQPGMPNMKVIMYIFPIMMIFFFNNYSAGLSYYYFISTLFSILIMVAIKQFFVDEEKLKAKMSAKKATVTTKGPKAKSKFQERLEAMQKAQQDKMKNK